jgi:autotransporter-associated beta strand protein
MKPKYLAFPLAIILASPSIAGTYTWRGFSDSTWTDSSNWVLTSPSVPADLFPAQTPDPGTTYADALTVNNWSFVGDDKVIYAGAVYNPGAGFKTTFTTGRGLVIGVGNGPSATPPNEKGSASLTVTSGTLAVVRAANGGSEPFMANRADSTLLINGGHLDLSAHVNNFRLIQEGFPGITSTITISSGALSCRVLDLLFDTEADPSTVFGDGIINLDGGVFTLSRFIRSAAADPNQTTSTINLNGGTLKTFAAIASPNVFMGPLPDTQFIIKTGGAIIDTNNFANTISADLLHDPSLGVSLDGGLTKNNTGTLTLSGINTYNGGTKINQGNLIITSDENLGAASGGITFTGTSNLNIGASIEGANRPVMVENGVLARFQLAGGVTFTNSGKISGTGTLEVRNTGTTGGTRNVILSSLENDFTGIIGFSYANNDQQTNLTVNSLADSSGAGNIVFNTMNNIFPAFIWGSEADGPLTLIHRQIQLAGTMGTTGAALINNQNETHPITINSDLLVSGTAGARRLTLSGVAGPTNVFAGDIADGIDSPVSVAKGNNASKWTLSGNNSHSGGTSLNGGTSGSQLNINSPTALGTGTFNIGGGDSGRIDNTSGNAITLTTNNPQNWNNNFVFVGTNDLNLGTGAVALGANRTIFVQGSTLTVGGVISGTDRGITKGSVGGTLLLTNSNTYTGATNVAAGILKLGATGSISDSASVSITAGATLDTSDQATYTIPGAQPVTFGINAGGSGSSGRIVAAGLNISAAVVTYNISGTPDDPVYVLATYTSLSGTPSFASVEPAPTGYTLDYAYQGNKIALVKDAGTPYDTWSGGAPFDGDANGDGVDNGLAFLLGAADPNVSALDRLPVVTQSGSDLVLTFSMLNAASRGTATLSVEHSSNLGISDPWTAVVVPETSGGPTSGVSFAVTPGSPLNNVTATISSSEGASGKLFGRLKAQP